MIGVLLGPAQALAGGTLTPNPSSLVFGNVGVGSSSPLSTTLTNTTPNLITDDTITGANASEFSTNSACDGQSPTNANPCTIQVTFSPTSAGMKTATLNIPNDGTNPNVMVPLSGTGANPSLTVPLVPNAPTEDPACAALRAKLKKAKSKEKRRKIRRKLRKLGC